MKWFDREEGKIKAKKNNFRLVVIPYDPFVDKKEGCYVYIKDLRTNNWINTDWADVRFDTKKKAKEWCKEFAAKYKDKRITNHTQHDWIGEWAYVN